MPTELLKTRDQRIVNRLTHLLPAEVDKLERARARARALPAMLRRHGLMQVLLFLCSKGAANGESESSRQNDGDLAIWLVAGLTSALGPEGDEEQAAPVEPAVYAEGLARVDLFTYLQRWEAAVEVSGWLKMLIEARCPPKDDSAAEDSSSEPLREEASP